MRYIVSVSIRDRLIEQLTREIQALKEELESFRLEVRNRRTMFPLYLLLHLLNHTLNLKDKQSEPTRNVKSESSSLHLHLCPSFLFTLPPVSPSVTRAVGCVRC